MLKIGITGGIGSGKSTVCKVFESLGVPVFYADDAAKRMMDSNAQLREQIIQLFGPQAYDENQLNRKYISEVVFGNSDLLARLNEIVHPATVAHGKIWMGKQSNPYVLKEAALLFETGSNKDLDFIIGVSSPTALRLSRAMSRGNASKKDIEARMNRQMKEEEKMSLCDFIIVNDDCHAILPQVLALHVILLKKAKALP